MSLLKTPPHLDLNLVLIYRKQGLMLIVDTINHGQHCP